jgi:Protein kinase domain
MAMTGGLGRDGTGWGHDGRRRPRGSWSGSDMTGPRQVGPYVLVERLGRGGMGEVWLAEDPTGASGGAPRRVALKLLDPHKVDDPDSRARFAREVEAARRVTGPTIAALLDADVDAPQPWLASAYVAGPTLADHVTDHGALGDSALRALGSALAQALVAIHAAGVVHRDLTPRNVVLGPDGPRVVDFGIARYDGAASITQTGARVGTPSWMAPERLTRDEVTAAGDVWSWGAVMAYAALGFPAVGGSGPEVVAHRIISGDVDLAGVPAWLAPWVAAAMSVAPAGRPTPAALVAAIPGTGAGLPPTAPGLAPTAPIPPTAGLPPTEPVLPPTAPGSPPTAMWPASAASPGAAPPSGVGAGPPDEPLGRRLAASPIVRALAVVTVLGAAVAVGLWASLLVVVIVTAVVMVVAVALRLSRLRLPDGARPLPPTWSVGLAGPVMLGIGLAEALGPVGGGLALLALIVLFVLLGGDIA